MLGKTVSGKKVVFLGAGGQDCAVGCELRPCSRAEKARILAPQPLSSQYLIRNLGAGPWPGTDPDSLSAHAHSFALTHTSFNPRSPQAEGRGHSERFNSR